MDLSRLFLFALSISVAYAGCFKCNLQNAGILAVFPEDEDYSSFLNPFNPRYIYKPSAFALPSTADEVAQVVRLAIMENLHIVARSGGHSYISNSLGGRDGVMVVDLRNMVDIHVDPVTHIAQVQTGNRLGNVALRLNEAGRATSHGTCPDVGIGGHTSYGGFGYVSRQWGLALDAVEAMDVVIANGTVVHASHVEHPDLFWAMRGAGGSFGIITAFYMKTYPVPPSVTYFDYVYSNLTLAEATNAITTYQAFILSGPPSTLGIDLSIGSNHSPGSLIVSISMTTQGIQQDGKRPVITIDVGSYIHSLEIMGREMGSQSLTNTSAPPFRSFTKSLMTPENEPMSEKAIAALVQFLAEEGSKFNSTSGCLLEAYGGPNSYPNGVPLDATAFAHRDTLFTFECSLPDPHALLADTPEVGYKHLDDLMNTIIKNMPNDWNYGAYPNYIDDSLDDWQKKYYGAHYPKLQRIKKTYDPGNVFQFPTGIELPSH